jgi:hypothetical protein
MTSGSGHDHINVQGDQLGDEVTRFTASEAGVPMGRAVPDFCWMWFLGNRLHRSNSNRVID